MLEVGILDWYGDWGPVLQKSRNRYVENLRILSMVLYQPSLFSLASALYDKYSTNSLSAISCDVPVPVPRQTRRDQTRQQLKKPILPYDSAMLALLLPLVPGPTYVQAWGAEFLDAIYRVGMVISISSDSLSWLPLGPRRWFG